MRRLILTLALAAGMVLGGASVALAHPAPAEANAQGFGGDGPFDTLSIANQNGIDNGIVPGYVVHSPNCIAHPDFH